MDDSRMSSITETLVTANEHPDMIFPVDAVSAPAKPVPVPTAQTAQSTDPYWVVAVDPTSRRLFYHDVNSGASSWVPPPGASVSVAPPPLAATASSPPRAILDQVSTAPAAFVSSTSATSAPVQTEESNVMAGKTSSRRVQIDAQPQVSEPPSSKHHRRKHSKSKKSASRKHRSHRSSSRNHRRRDTSTSSYSETASSSSRSRSGTVTLLMCGPATHRGAS